ncbi:TRAP transporter substrate-binding protein DctP [Enterovirga sp.]|uniref:TRAP transporter substrate-binding protein DctP n=1 Tax=Enterovirga sp. TaxID=2026350 RepID=UPI002C9AC9F1|nr:TRAP transporter substrate-binding protein DctP [Enterovirga sp.]HMO29031.1 TRAP transporter substrate-binding protein DctP [Enterovirga sp.]
MTFTRRHILAGGLAAPALVGAAGRAQAARTLKISHQFPGGTIDEGDFRDRACRIFARDIAKRTGGSLTAEVFPNSSLMKTNAQFSAMRKGALDMSLYPMPYAGGEVPELNIGLMPALVTSYEQAAAWKKAPVGRMLTKILEDKGIVMLSWIWQAGGVAARERAIVVPDDAKGQKVRGGSREMDLMFQRAGAAVLSLPSNESYAAMQTGAADAILTSSTSLISFRLEELAKHLTTGRGKSYWFMCEPLMMSKAVFDSLTPAEKEAAMAVGEEIEAFGFKGAKEDDERVAQVFAKAGAKTHDLDAATIEKWRVIARETAWKDYAARNARSAELLKLAEAMI